MTLTIDRAADPRVHPAGARASQAQYLLLRVSAAALAAATVEVAGYHTGWGLLLLAGWMGLDLGATFQRRRDWQRHPCAGCAVIPLSYASAYWFTEAMLFATATRGLTSRHDPAAVGLAMALGLVGVTAAACRGLRAIWRPARPAFVAARTLPLLCVSLLALLLGHTAHQLTALEEANLWGIGGHLAFAAVATYALFGLLGRLFTPIRSGSTAAGTQA